MSSPESTEDLASLRARRDQAIHEGRYSEATDLAGAVSHRFPNEVVAEDRFCQALCFQACRVFWAAIALYDSCLDMEPHHARALTNKGICLLNMDEAADAFECFRAALAVTPDIGPLWFRLGYYHLGQDRLRIGAHAFRHAIAVALELGRRWAPPPRSTTRVEAFVARYADGELPSLDEFLTP